MYQVKETIRLIGMEVPEKYKENFDVSSESPSGVRKLVAVVPTKGLRSKRRSSPCIF